MIHLGIDQSAGMLNFHFIYEKCYVTTFVDVVDDLREIQLFFFLGGDGF